MTCDLATLMVGQQGHIGAAYLHRHRAAGTKAATLRQGVQGWRAARNPLQPLAGAGQGGEGLAQGAGVRVVRGGQDLGGGGNLDQIARIHHADAVAEFNHQAKVMGDEQDREAEGVFQPANLFDDVALYQHIQGRGGFVHDDQLGVQAHGDCDADPLPHPA